jgi:hypothetical protein
MMTFKDNAGAAETFHIGACYLGLRRLQGAPCVNDYEQHVAWAEYCKLMQSLALAIPTRHLRLI